MKLTAKLLGAVAAVAMMGLAAAPAHAQDATDELLLRLKEKGILTDEEFQAEKAKILAS